MKINRNNLLQQWALDFFLGRTSRKVAFNQKSKSVKNEDTVQISWRAKRAMRNAEIEKMLNSGEPLKDVTFEEFCDYYYDTHGCTLSNSLPQYYSQALKGDNASLRGREWRTNPEYIIPQRLFSSPEVTADREAALKKYRNGEELFNWEKRVMNTFSNAHVKDCVIQSATQERQVNIMQKKIANALSSAGIQLGENDELTFEAWGKSLKIGGNIDETALNAVRIAFSENNINGRSLQGIYSMAHKDYAQNGGFELSFLKSAEDYLLDEGSGVTVFDLSLDEDRNVIGLPKSLDELIKKDAIGEFSDNGLDEKYSARTNDILKARYIREAFRSAVDTIQNGDYNRLKNMTCKLTYKNGVLSC